MENEEIKIQLDDLIHDDKSLKIVIPKALNFIEEQHSQLKAKDEENQKLKECLKTVRSPLYDQNNKETLLTNIIDETLTR